MRSHRGAIVLKVALLLTIAIAGFGKAVHELWNWLMPGIFGLTAITFWQAVGLLALSWLLFGGWRGFRGPGSGHREHWRGRMLERWERMTPEERDKFREGIRGPC
ncbi:MAG: hypothetical protein ACKV2U_23420 [Bryobacteraceae bacterium]